MLERVPGPHWRYLLGVRFWIDSLAGVNNGEPPQEAYCVPRISAKCPLLNLPSVPRFSPNVQVLINELRINRGNSRVPSCNVGFAGLNLFRLGLA